MLHISGRVTVGDSDLQKPLTFGSLVPSPKTPPISDLHFRLGPAALPLGGTVLFAALLMRWRGATTGGPRQ